MDILPESYFLQNTTRDRGLQFIDETLKFSDEFYKVTGNGKRQLPEQSFPQDLEGGLSGWIDKKRNRGEAAVILDLAAGEGSLAKDLSIKEDVTVVSLDAYPVKLDDSPTVIQHDANNPLPFGDGSFGFILCTYAIPYLVDPVKTINELIRVAQTGGYIVMNGANRLNLEDGKRKFFSSTLAVTDEDLIVYNDRRFSDGEWIIIQVNNSNYRLDYSLDLENSFTVQNKGADTMYLPSYTSYGTSHQLRDVRNLAQFVYKKNK